LLSKVSDSFGLISNRLSALQAEEQKSVSKKAETNSKLNKFSGIFEAIKNYFDKDNELKKQELVVEMKS